MAEIRRCTQCNGLIARIDPTPHIISLNRVWVHITRLGRIKRKVQHPPVL